MRTAPDPHPPSAFLQGFAAWLLTALAAAGLPYLLRGLVALPGPHVEGAPLDELSRRANVSLFLFAAIWICAGVLLAQAPPRHWRRRRLIFRVLLVTFAWQLVTTAISLKVVRQVSTTSGITGAVQLGGAYIAPLCAALGAALFRRPGKDRSHG